MKKTTLLLLLSTAIYTNAATVNWGALEDNGFSAYGQDLAQGNWARVGFFNASDSVIQANVTNPLFLNSIFTEFASTQIGFGAGVDGHFSIGSSANPESLSGPVTNIVNQQIYYWVLNSTNTSNLNLALSSATAQGVFYVNKANDSDWAFPVQSPQAGVVTTDITDLTNVAGNALVPGATIVLGGFGGETSNVTFSPNFTLAAVPEPTSAFLIAIGAAGLMTRRRRQS
jgi:hypothetical protein